MGHEHHDCAAHPRIRDRHFHRAIPFGSESTVRLVYLGSYNAVLALVTALIRMSTFSLVGAIIPVAAAGSLFAGFMSVANLAYSFCYSSGSWLYEHAGLADDEEGEITAAVKRLLNDALERAEESPLPSAEGLEDAVFASPEDLDTPHHK